MEDVKLLKKMKLFNNLTPMELVQVGKVVRNLKFKKGQTIIQEGSYGGSIFFIKSGHLIVKRMVRTKEKELGRFQTGDHFGEISFLDGQPRSASIQTLEDSEILEIDKNSFDQLLHHDIKLQFKLMQALLDDLCAKLRRTNDVLVLVD